MRLHPPRQFETAWRSEYEYVLTILKSSMDMRPHGSEELLLVVVLPAKTPTHIRVERE